MEKNSFWQRLAIDFTIKQDQIGSKAASQDQLTTNLNYFKSNQFPIKTKRFQIQEISNPSDFQSE